MCKPLVPDLRIADNTNELAQMLGVNHYLFASVAQATDQKRFYRELHLPKKNPSRAGEFRTVFSIPDGTLSDAHKTIARRLEVFVRDVEIRYPHAACHGYVKKRSTRTNAERHCGSRYILHADIEQFFHSITRERVQAMLVMLGLKPNVSGALSSFLTINERLPLGLHTSPLLANLACLDLDDQLSDLAQKFRATYTRYADDITFSSSTSRLPGQIELESILHAHGFSISKRKCFVTKNGQSHFVTGLSVSDAVPHVPRQMKRRLRQEIYMAEKFGLKSHLGRAGYPRYGTGINNIGGRLHYLAGVEHELGNRLLRKWNGILVRNQVIPTYYPRHERPLRVVELYCDESQVITHRGEAYLLAFVAIEEVKEVQEVTARVARSFLVDPFEAGRKDKIMTRGLHFSDATEDLRTEYVRALADCPFRVFLAVDLVSKFRDKTEAYLELTRFLLKDRLIGYDRAKVEMIFEENSQIAFARLTAAVTDIYSELARANSRRPIAAPEIKQASKLQEPLLSVPDFALGVFGAYLENPRDIDAKRFERLRDKYRVIADRANERYYSRFKPFLPW